MARSDTAYPLTVDPLIFLETKITAYDGAAYDYFSVRVALSGDTALVGADGGDVGANADQGSAYVFVRSGGVWTLQAHLTASDGDAGDSFGCSVALSGDAALVGACSDNVDTNVDQGSAYVFVRSGTSWIQQAQLTASDGAAGDKFGFSVALSGNTALVGAFDDNVGANAKQGSAYVFIRSGTSWTQQAQLTASDGAVSDRFGNSVALSGDTALLGAYAYDEGGNSGQGSAYVFVRSEASWTQQAQFTAPDGAAFDLFGTSVALSGDSALVGAPHINVGTNARQGSAYVFVRSGTSWTQQARLTAADGAAYDKLGYSVALSGDTALVGAIFFDMDANTDQGSAYVFIRSDTFWTQQVRLTASDGAAYDLFGYSAALSGDTALVGAWWDNVGANVFQGSVYLFGIHPWRSDHDLAAGVDASSTTPYAGNTVYLTATIINYGPADAADVLVKAPLPAGLTHVTSSASTGTYSPAGEGYWNVGALSVDETATVSIEATVNPGTEGKSLVFQVALAGSDTNPANNAAATTLKVHYLALSLPSVGAQDGWVREFSETASKGGSINAAAIRIFIGDDFANRQYRSVLSFDTAALPNTAVVRSATLWLKSAGIVGTSPFTTHGALNVDLAKGAFTGNAALQTTDFEAPATRLRAGSIDRTLLSGWYRGALAATALRWVNKTGLTQLRLAFARDDNNDRGADYLMLWSGDAPAASRPMLVIEYSLP